MKIRLSIIAGLLLIANLAMAYTITGTVNGNGKPLPGVVITRIGYIGGSDTETAYAVTDIDGKYSIDSGTGNPITIVASFATYTSEMKVADGRIVDFDLKETPYVPVKFFSSILDQREIVGFTMSQQFKSMGLPVDDFSIYPSDNLLIFGMSTSNGNAFSGLSIKNFADTTIKGYLTQLQADGELDNFLSQMKSSGMKWGFGVYNTTTDKWLQYKEYDAEQIRKLL